MRIREDKKIILETANKIKEARESKGLTQAEVAKKAGIHSNSYAKIERGVSSPKGVSLTKIAKALGIKASEILPV